MTAVTAPVALDGRRRDRARPWALTALGVLVAWACWRATSGVDVVNTRGWSSFAEFWRSIAHPETNIEFLRLTAEAMAVTAAYAVVGTALSVVVGLAGGLVVAERPWETAGASGVGRLVRRAARLGARIAFVVPRGVHEVIWALLLIQVLGFDPLVAVLAIGLQFGAVTAKVYGEILDDTDPAPYRALRAGGARRPAAVAYGLVPLARPALVSYGFYRLECAVRSAAVLGIVGAGGLGFQLDLSFESLRYDEIWTLVAALMLLSGVADRWSSLVRRSPSATVVRRSWLALAVAVPVAWWYVGLDPTSLWSERTRRLAVDLAAALWPPRLGPGGFDELLSATVDTLALSVLATAIALVGGLALAVIAARPPRPDAAAGRRLVSWAARTVLLLLRAIPAPIWAFLVVLVLFPGIWPGAVALGVYNAGVLGRLFAEVIEDHDDRARRLLDTAGASRTGQLLYAVLPSCATRLANLALYRWEVITRETVIVGVVGAAGLGRLIQEHLVARDFAAVLGAVGALIALTMIIDALSGHLRRAFA
ncbi:MAG: ABC transporter permease subunit [Actinomycetota bacterium]|nr:ABC transporter permease subunit [Actinomycetota bacterium]